MNRTRQARHGARAFTLIEVLIAVVAFALVLAAINAVFYGALRLRNKTVEAVEAAVPVEHALAVLKRDLAGLVPPGGTLAGDLQTDAVGGMSAGGSSVRSGSASGLGSGVAAGPEFFTGGGRIDGTTPFAEVQKVSYALLESTNRLGERDLYRLVTRNLLAPGTELPTAQKLMNGVRALDFAYYSGSEWQLTWDSTQEESKLPLAIRVRPELEQEPGATVIPAPYELVVPVAVRARTNAVDQATGGGA